MGNNISAAQARRNIRVWVDDDSHPKGGYWYAASKPEEEHGKPNTYNNWYCRCPACTKANSQKFKKYYHENKDKQKERRASGD